jgi:hypothetical protein
MGQLLLKPYNPRICVTLPQYVLFAYMLHVMRHLTRKPCASE